MMRTPLLVLLLIKLVHSGSYLRLPLSWQFVSPKSDESKDCVGGVCKLPKVISKNFEAINSSTSIIEPVFTSEVGNVANELHEDISTKNYSKPEDYQQSIDSLCSMGWTKQEAEDALEKSNYDITSAIEQLEIKEETNEKAKDLIKLGWRAEASQEAILAAEGNVTLAAELLQSEENAIQSQFEEAVKGMVDNGWEEYIARQALLAQWSTDQSRSNGQNITIPAEELALLKPTLKEIKSKKLTPTSAKSNPSSSQSSPATSTKSKDQPPPTPSKKEDCVFEVTSANLQKIVLESPVPVLIDVYADWCGPCKQLGPILENAAMKSGGMFRLAKVNSDKEGNIARLLEVEGLPTVFALNKGKLTDRFVGMLPQDQLQTFLIRAITGYGDRVQATELSEGTLGELSEKLSMTAGMASFSYSKQEKMRALVSFALALPSAFLNTTIHPNGTVEILSKATPSVGIKLALQFLDKAAKDIYNGKYREINPTGKNVKFITEVFPCEAAMRVLDIAGFKPKPSNATLPAEDAAKTASEAVCLSLVHNNAAILKLVSQHVQDVFQKQYLEESKARAIRNTKTAVAVTAPKAPKKDETDSPVAAGEKLRSMSDMKAEIKARKEAKERQTIEQEKAKLQKKRAEGTITLQLSDQSVVHKTYPDGTILAEAIRQAIEASGDAEGSMVVWEADGGELRYPMPRRALKRDDPFLNKTLKEILAKEGAGASISFTLRKVDSSGLEITSADRVKTKKNEKSKIRIGGMGLFNKKSEKKGKTDEKKDEIDPKKGGRGGVHTLYSTGILKHTNRKHNAYFGGDSTLVLTGEEDEEEDQGEEKGEGGKEGEDQTETKEGSGEEEGGASEDAIESQELSSNSSSGTLEGKSEGSEVREEDELKLDTAKLVKKPKKASTKKSKKSHSEELVEEKK